MLYPSFGELKPVEFEVVLGDEVKFVLGDEIGVVVGDEVEVVLGDETRVLVGDEVEVEEFVDELEVAELGVMVNAAHQ